MDVSPSSDGAEPPQYQHYDQDQMQEYYQYNVQIGNDEQCRKALPNKSAEDASPSSMSHSKENSRMKDRSSGKKRVVFEDQADNDINNQKEYLKSNLFPQNENMFEESNKKLSQEYVSDNESPAIEKYPHAEVDYDHFHDESMSRLEAVLHRQKERLENLGGFSGKSSQISKKTVDQQENLEKVYDDLEDEINNIRNNLEASQHSENYSPMRVSGSHGNKYSSKKDDMSLSPSDLGKEDDFAPRFS